MNKNVICSVMGVIGGAIATLYGGWGAALTTLVIFMIIDYLSGFAVAMVFKKSPKTENGALESRAGFKGLCKKGMILLIVLVACRLDLMMNTTFVKDTAVVGFVANETVSIIENAGLMGIPIPPIIRKAIDMMIKNDKDGENDEQ